MDFIVIWHNCSLYQADVLFEAFIRVGQRSRSGGFNKLSVDHLPGFFLYFRLQYSTLKWILAMLKVKLDPKIKQITNLREVIRRYVSWIFKSITQNSGSAFSDHFSRTFLAFGLCRANKKLGVFQIIQNFGGKDK